MAPEKRLLNTDIWEFSNEKIASLVDNFAVKDTNLKPLLHTDLLISLFECHS